QQPFAKRAYQPMPTEVAPSAPPMTQSSEVTVTGETPTISLASTTAQVQEQQTSVFFQVPKRETIPSDGNPHNTTIAIENLDAKTEYTCVPKLSQFAYLKANVTNTTDYPFLPGKSNIFLGTNFTGNAYLYGIAPAESFDIYFGIDEGIKVKRQENKVNSKNKVSFSYRIEATNYKKDPQSLTILDQLPMPQNQEIKVKLLDSTTPPNEKQDDGTTKWIVNLAPQEKKEIRFDFEVEYPKDKQITGL